MSIFRAANPGPFHTGVTFQSQRKQGFTLIQVMITIGILGILSAILIGSFRRASAPARRAECDIHLKEISMALDTYRQEKGHLPTVLSELVDDNYIQPQTMRCPSDPVYDESRKANPKYNSYNDSYVIREPRDSNELPIVVCAFHEKDGPFGIQAYKGGYTKQFTAHFATLPEGGYTGAVTITRPGEGVLSLPAKGDKPLLLRGGDRIRTGAGTATVSFEDGSTASVQSNTDMSVLQSFTEGQNSGGLYTLIRQFTGRVNYYVNPSARSHFDVVTPTATAGALGTRFTLDVVPASALGTSGTTLKSGQLETVLTVTEHSVALTTPERTIEVADKEPAVAAHSPKNVSKKRVPRVISVIKSLLGR
jgi:prepilin-type N-terminal cleavage/methylation domain-containing protein